VRGGPGRKRGRPQKLRCGYRAELDRAVDGDTLDVGGDRYAGDLRRTSGLGGVPARSKSWRRCAIGGG